MKLYNYSCLSQPVTVPERSKAVYRLRAAAARGNVRCFASQSRYHVAETCTVFARSEPGIVGSNPTQGMDVRCLCVLFCVYVQIEVL
jgi:hypothetical protein